MPMTGLLGGMENFQNAELNQATGMQQLADMKQLAQLRSSQQKKVDLENQATEQSMRRQQNIESLISRYRAEVAPVLQQQNAQKTGIASQDPSSSMLDYNMGLAKTLMQNGYLSEGNQLFSNAIAQEEKHYKGMHEKSQSEQEQAQRQVTVLNAALELGAITTPKNFENLFKIIPPELLKMFSPELQQTIKDGKLNKTAQGFIDSASRSKQGLEILKQQSEERERRAREARDYAGARLDNVRAIETKARTRNEELKTLVMTQSLASQQNQQELPKQINGHEIETDPKSGSFGLTKVETTSDGRVKTTIARIPKTNGRFVLNVGAASEQMRQLGNDLKALLATNSKTGISIFGQLPQPKTAFESIEQYVAKKLPGIGENRDQRNRARSLSSMTLHLAGAQGFGTGLSTAKNKTDMMAKVLETPNDDEQSRLFALVRLKNIVDGVHQAYQISDPFNDEQKKSAAEIADLYNKSIPISYDEVPYVKLEKGMTLGRAIEKWRTNYNDRVIVKDGKAYRRGKIPLEQWKQAVEEYDATKTD